MRVVIAPDSFKGSLTSVEVATALADGWRAARPDDEVLLAPLADGGEGTLVAIEAAGGWEWRTAPATDPIGRPVEARWLRSGGRAAGPSSSSRRPPGCRGSRPRSGIRSGASTRGTGEVLRAVLDDGIRTITLGIGGSATTDGGAGILRALGRDRSTKAGVDLAGLDPRLAEVRPAHRLRRHEPAAGPDRRRRDVRAAEGRDARAGRAARRRARRATRTRCAPRPGETSARRPGAGAAGGTAFGLLSIGDRFRPSGSCPASRSSWRRRASARSSTAPTS